MIVLGPRRWLWGVVTLLVLSPAMRVWFPSPTAAARLDLVADSLAAGCLLAGLRPWLTDNPTIARAMRSSWVIALAVLGVFAVELVVPRPSVAPPWLTQLALISIQNLLIAVVIHWTILNHTGRVGRVLNWRPIAFVGTISYSLYIWQQPFFNHDIRSPLTAFPLNLAAAFACALLSFYLVERPSLALRQKLDGWFRERAGVNKAVGRPSLQAGH
jgi:peptidoglycan/LPS O-acetylase OafA/YrhL